jgi:hypothetical protein
MKNKLKINDFIIRGRRAGVIKTMLSEFIHLVSQNNQLEELIRASGQELPEEIANNKQLLKIMGKNPAIKEVAIEVSKLQESIKTIEDEVEKQKIEDKIQEYNTRLLDVFITYEEEFDKELEEKKLNLKFDIVDKFFEAKDINHISTEDLSLPEVDMIILEITKEPENDYDKSNFLSIQSSMNRQNTMIPSIELLEQTDLVDTTEKS